MKMANIFKNPPAFNSDFNYENWKKDIEIWRKLTDIEKNKQALAIHLVLTGKARQASTEISITELNSDNGVDKLIEKLDDLFLLDESRRQFGAFQNLYNLKRSPEVDVGQFVNEFERHYFRFTQEKMTLPDAVMAFMLLTSCSLSDPQFQLVMSGMTKITYENMKCSLKRIFSGRLESSAQVQVKEEPVWFGDESVYPGVQKSCEQNVYYGRNFNSGVSRGYFGASRNRGGRNRGRGSFNQTSVSRGQNRKLNPLGPDGFPSKCAICESKYHWARSCPHSYEKGEQTGKEESNENEVVHISLFTGYADGKEESKMEKMLQETWGCTVLDSGCSLTVCGERWLSDFIESMSEEDKKKIEEKSTSSSFTFGDGRPVPSLRRLILPCMIVGIKCSLQTDVVPCNIPLLLSRAAMKKAAMIVDYGNDNAIFGGRQVKLSLTSSGHHFLPLSF